ncbi:MAG: CAP domain-containing protein [Capsulimonadales bacterium]|nr:CAP domain-containing protein [Capsulimonadales bacterium]
MRLRSRSGHTLLLPFLLLAFFHGTMARGQVRVVTLGVAPTETVRLARPRLAWRIGPCSNAVREVRMTLNGQPVPASFAADRHCAEGVPERPLSAGEYRVRCELTFDGGAEVVKMWSFHVGIGATERWPAVPPRTTAMMNVVDRLRERTGLPPLTLDPRLCAAADAYSRRLASRSVAHPEHTPELAALIREFGYPGPCFESVGLGVGSPADILRALFDAPYHRAPFLLPGKAEIGIGVARETTGEVIVTLLFALGGENEVVVYPRDGQTEVPIEWNPAEEGNEPLKPHGATGLERTGYPITLFVQGPDADRLRNVKASLTDETGAVIPFFLNTADNDPLCPANGVLLIPEKPLLSGATYRVRIAAAGAPERTYEEKWTFSTARAGASAPN